MDQQVIKLQELQNKQQNNNNILNDPLKTSIDFSEISAAKLFNVSFDFDQLKTIIKQIMLRMRSNEEKIINVENKIGVFDGKLTKYGILFYIKINIILFQV